MSQQVWPGGNRFPDFDDTNAFARNTKKAPLGGPPKDALGVPLGAKLPVTQATLNLPPNPNVGITTPRIGVQSLGDSDYIEFVNTVADLSYPRLINVWTEVRRDPGASGQITTTPFQMHVTWTSGGGKGGELWTTGSGGGIQMFVNAKSLKIDLANWSSVIRPNAFLSVQDGSFGQTQDLHYIVRQVTLAPGATRDFGIVPYARSVVVGSDNPAQRPNIVVQLLDSAGNPQAAFLATDGPISIEAASKLRIRNGDAAFLASYCLDFTLGYE